MQYKIIANITNDELGTKELNKEELSFLTDGDTTLSGVSLSTGDKLSVVCDLLNRYDISSCIYYYSGDGAISVESSASEGVWSTVSGSYNSGNYIVSLDNYFPRWIRITHDDISSASIYEIELFSNSTNVLFGNTGNFNSYGMGVVKDTIQEIKIFNNSSISRDIFVFIDNNEDIATDELVSISIDSSGPFYSKYDRSLNFPTDFGWDNGAHFGTYTTTSGHLTISGTSTSGVYYSPVFIISDERQRFFWERDYNNDSSVDFVSSVGSEDCFGVRMYNHPPTGSWVNGTMPEDTDPFWSITDGSLEFFPVPNSSILELRNNKYMQFTVTLSGSTHPYIYKAGVEYPLAVSGIAPSSYGEVYLKINATTNAGQQLDLLCWYDE